MHRSEKCIEDNLDTLENGRVHRNGPGKGDDISLPFEGALAQSSVEYYYRTGTSHIGGTGYGWGYRPFDDIVWRVEACIDPTLPLPLSFSQ